MVLLMLSITVARSQSKPGSIGNGIIPEVKPPSALAASLGKFGAWPVSYYTGVPNISVPIYEIKTGKLSLPVSLAYHASGIKVEDVGSSTGLGWALNAGGVITRTVVGLPDNEDQIGYLSRLKAGYVFQKNYQLDDPKNWVFFRKITDGDIDSEPDAYFYNFNGHSGKFFFDEKGDFHSIPENALKLIQTPFMFGNSASVWEIIDEAGNTYTFGSTDSAGGVEQTRISSSSQTAGDFVETAWYLTRMVSPDKTDTIFLQYQDKSETYALKANHSWRELTHHMEGMPVGWQKTGVTWSDVNQTEKLLYNGDPNGSDVSSTRQTNIGKATLSLIRWSQGEMKFKSGTPRNDIPQGTLLDSIEVMASQTNNLLKKYVFQYSYSNDRCFLDSISEFNKTRTDKHVHQFYYYPGLPNRYSNSQDHWGYFNSRGNLNLLPNDARFHSVLTADREPDELAMKAGSLYKVIYPTGGYTEFEYEAHTYQGGSVVTPGAPTSTVGNFYAWVANYNPKMPRGFDSLIVFNVSQGQSDASINIEFTDYFRAISKTESWLPYVKLERLSGSDYFVVNKWDAFDLFPGGNIRSNPDGSYNFIKDIRVELASGTYRLSVGNDNCARAYNCEEEWKKGHVVAGLRYRSESISTPGSPAPPPVAGGLRIKAIKNYDNLSLTPAETKRFEYSPGILLSYPSYVHYYAIDRASSTEAMMVLCHSNFARYIEQTSTSQAILGFTQGSSVGYQYVKEYTVNEQGIDNGYTEYKYLYSPDSTNQMYFDHTYWDNWDISAFNKSIPANNYDYKRGLLSEKTVYARNATGYTPVSRLKEEYSFNDGDTSKRYKRITALRVKNLRPGAYSAQCGDFVDGYFIPLKTDNWQYDFAYGFYNIVTSWVQKLSSETTLYNSADGSAIKTLSKYYYDNNRHLGLTRTESTDSKQQTVTTSVKYAHEMLEEGVTKPYADMVSRNMINIPIEQRVIKNGHEEISREKVNYAAFSVNMIAPSSIESSVMGYPLEEKTTIQKYDYYGNILQYLGRDGLISTLVYDHNNGEIVASAINATSDDIAYTSFETASKGNWQYADFRNTSTSLTGKASYLLSQGDIVKSGLNADKNYMVSYWLKDGTAKVNGQSVASVKSLKGWSLYLHKLSGGITKITLNGSGIVDELRLYPQDAVMETTVYEPLVGVIARADENNIFSFYEYDDFSRLLHIKDQYGNVVKKYEYSYVRPGIQSLNTVFYNVEKARDFRKNDCGLGDGSIFTYHVAAGKYKSYVSQEDADAQADEDIYSNGQNAANENGLCNFYNVEKSQTFTRQTCGLGYVGGSYNYIVPAKRYTVQTSQKAADSLAQKQIDIYGQADADANGPCNTDNTANFFVGQHGTISVPPFSVTITNLSGTILYQYTFKGVGDDPLPYKQMLSASSGYTVKIEGMQSFNAVVNGTEQTIVGTKTWNVSTPIIIEVYK